MEQPTLETGRLLLRPLEESDAQGMYELYCDAEHSTMVGPPGVDLDSTRRQIEARIGRGMEWSGMLVMIAKATDQFVGYCAIQNSPIGDGEPELLYAVHPDARGEGYAREGAAKLIEWLAANCTVNRVIARVKSANAASQAVLEQLGFSYVEDRADERGGPPDRVYERRIHPEESKT